MEEMKFTPRFLAQSKQCCHLLRQRSREEELWGEGDLFTWAWMELEVSIGIPKKL